MPQGMVPAGSESRANVHMGYPGTWESSPVPIVKEAAIGLEAGYKQDRAGRDDCERTEMVEAIKRKKQSAMGILSEGNRAMEMAW